MKRSFKVATVFTGAAACAVALTPAAEAAPVAPGATARPDTIGGNCNPSLAQVALHLYYTPSESHYLAACFSGEGTYWLGHGKRFAYYCAAQSSGYLYIGGVRRKFTGGTHNLYGQSVSKISITNTNKYSLYYCPPYGS